MKIARLALGTATLIFGLVFSASAVLGVFDYIACRRYLLRYQGWLRIEFAYACNYDMRIGVAAAALALAFGVATYLLLRSRWRRPPTTVAERLEALAS